MSWSIHTGTAIFEHAKTWQQTKLQAGIAHPVLDAQFLMSALQLMGKYRRRAYLAIHRTAGHPNAAILLERIGCGFWQTLNTPHIPLSPLCMSAELQYNGSLEPLHRLFRSLPGIPLLLRVNNYDPDYSPDLLSVNQSCIERFHVHHTVSVNTTGDFDDYWSARSKSLQASVRKLMNRLEAEGLPVSFIVLTRPDQMALAVDQHGLLEQSGWKGISGKPLTKENEESRFYTTLLEKHATTGNARVFQLYLGGIHAASQLTLIDGSTMMLIKTGYQDSLSRFAPGRLLDYLMFKNLFTDNEVLRVEYCNIASNDDLRWATASRSIYQLDIFRNKAICMNGRQLRKFKNFISNAVIDPFRSTTASQIYI